MHPEIKKYIKDNYPDYSIWIDEENIMISIRKFFNQEVVIPVKLIIDLMYICGVSHENICISIEKATMPNNCGYNTSM